MYNLLIVDDEKIVADGLAQYIDWTGMGFRVVGVANCVAEAVEIIKQEEVHVLLTDIIMGSKSGIDLIEEAIEINQDLKSIILSGHENFAYAKSAIRLGVYEYLVKPVDFEELEKVFCGMFEKLEEKYKKVEIKGKKEDVEEKSEGIIINTVKEYIHNHYNENISLNHLAEIVYVHPTYLSILFKKKTSENFTEYLAKLRVEKAKGFLEDISLRIGDVSNKVGYDSPKHFSKIFKEITGFTPKDYRNKIHRG